MTTDNALHDRTLRLLASKLYDIPLMSNIRRTDYVEALICQALGEEWQLPADWTGWDLEKGDSGFRLLVKQSAALQPWHNDLRSENVRPRFDIAPRNGTWTDCTDEAEWMEEHGRHADAFIFAWHPEKDRGKADHRKAEQWEFYVVPEYRLTEECGEQKTIGLESLRKLAPPLTHAQLSGAVEAEVARQDAEDYYRAVTIMEGVRKGEVRVYSSEEVRAHLGLDN